MKKVFGLLLCFNFLNAHAQEFSKSMLKLPDTGQLSDFTTTFGEDVDFSINPPGFEFVSDSILRDTITGLYWQAIDGGEMTFEQAIQYCQNLRLGAFSNWRLPNAQEAFSILNQGTLNPALATQFFTKTSAEYWWTSTVQVGDSNKVWVSNAGGGIGNHPKTETISAGGTKKFHVRAVRNNNPPEVLKQHFEILPNAQILDWATQLIWLPYNNLTLTWEEALLYAKHLSDSLHESWRLPNIKELQSIVNYQLSNPALDKSMFKINLPLQFWSSTSIQNQATKAWYLDTKYGITTYDVKTNAHPVLFVKNQSSSTTGMQPVIDPQTAISVFPNPFRSQLQLHNSESNIPFQIFDAQGHVLLNGNALEQVDFSSYPAGMYVLLLKGKQLQIFKLMKVE